MITEEQVRTRREEIVSDLEKIQEAIVTVEKQRAQLQTNLIALQGALQQVDFFLKDETNEEEVEDE